MDFFSSFDRKSKRVYYKKKFGYAEYPAKEFRAKYNINDK